MKRDEDFQGATLTFLLYLYRGMRPDHRGLIAVILFLGSITMCLFGWYLWALVSIIICASLLWANRRNW